MNIEHPTINVVQMTWMHKWYCRVISLTCVLCRPVHCPVIITIIDLLNMKLLKLQKEIFAKMLLLSLQHAYLIGQIKCLQFPAFLCFGQMKKRQNRHTSAWNIRQYHQWHHEHDIESLWNNQFSLCKTKNKADQSRPTKW